MLHVALKKIEHIASAYEVLILNGLEEVPMREVVERLGIPDGTARERTLRGKRALRELLEADAGEELAA